MRGLIFCLAVLPVLFGSSVTAQDLIFSLSQTKACLAEHQPGPALDQCIGDSASACMDKSEGGYSTVGMGGCISLELEYWDARLNAAYKVLMAREKADDLEFGGGENGVPMKSTALRAMQRVWISWRDATCDYERSLWGGGTGGGPATVGCLMRLTGEQTLYLEATNEEY